MQTKIDDLENRGRHKNLKIVGLPEKAEGSGSLPAFLGDMIPKWLDLPADFPALDIERAHRSPTFAPNNTNSALRSILVWFLRFTDKEEILKVALKKTVTHNGSELRFYFISAGLLQKRREFATVSKALAACGLYQRFTYPARLRCLHNGKIKLFNDLKSAKAFLDSLDG